ncbi:MFS transporter [Medicago truncatula]|uniref:MFS transporter n=1 Tax=Medicago truncatula TaxID=3880 RepID=A0A072UCZ5_MEDTR|nr:MFS transporter [Medicago truncatula]
MALYLELYLILCMKPKSHKKKYPTITHVNLNFFCFLRMILKNPFYDTCICSTEIVPKERRGALTTLNQFMIATGSSASFIIGTVLSWRALSIIGLIPTAVLLLGLFFIPESPRWLAKRGRTKDFVAALQILRGKGADIYNVLKYSFFGSILTFGAMIGAITSGPIADFVGRKGVNSGKLLWSFRD